VRYLVPDRNGRCDAVHAQHVARRIEIIEGRMKSAFVKRRLAAGESVAHTVDLQDWASRPTGERIPPGDYAIGVTYSVAAPADPRRSWDDLRDELWAGSIEAVSKPLTITGSIPGDRCAIAPEPTRDSAIESAAQPGIAAGRASPGR
jgi:hypothetical protein